MKISKSHRFEYPIEKVWDMFHDPKSHVEKFASMGHSEIKILDEKSDETSLTLKLQRKVEMEIPSVAAKFISPTNTVTSTDYWESRGETYGGHFSVDIAGVPAETKGLTELKPAGAKACDYTVTLDLKIKIPLLGDKIAKAISPQLEAQIEQEFVAAESWLKKKKK